VDVAGAEVESLRQGLAEQLPGFVLAQQFDLAVPSFTPWH
jgi:hypothetical protein